VVINDPVSMKTDGTLSSNAKIRIRIDFENPATSLRKSVTAAINIITSGAAFANRTNRVAWKPQHMAET